MEQDAFHVGEHFADKDIAVGCWIFLLPGAILLNPTNRQSTSHAKIGMGVPTLANKGNYMFLNFLLNFAHFTHVANMHRRLPEHLRITYGCSRVLCLLSYYLVLFRVRRRYSVF